MIIHISGSSGVGKTSLGTIISNEFGKSVAVIETDSFIGHGSREADELDRLIGKPKEYEKKWKSFIEKGIRDSIKNNARKPIIFVGALNHFGLGWIPMEMDADHRFCLNIDIADLMKQYYIRLSFSPLEFWVRVAKGIEFVPSSIEFANYHYDLMDWHKKHGFEIMFGSEIINAIRKILGKSKKK